MDDEPKKPEDAGGTTPPADQPVTPPAPDAPAGGDETPATPAPEEKKPGEM